MQNWRYSYFGIRLKVVGQEPINFPHYYSSSSYSPLSSAAGALFLKEVALKREPNFSPWSTGEFSVHKFAYETVLAVFYSRFWLYCARSLQLPRGGEDKNKES